MCVVRVLDNHETGRSGADACHSFLALFLDRHLATASLNMPSIAGVDVPTWCVAGAAALTPAAIYAYLLRNGRQRQAFFADTPQPEETGPIMGGLSTLAEIQSPVGSLALAKKHFKDLGLTWGVRLPQWLFPNMEFSLYTADPAIVAEIQSRKDVFHSRKAGLGFATTIPLGLLALRSEGPQSKWALHRRLIAPLFSDRFLEGYSAGVCEKAQNMRYVLSEIVQDKEAAKWISKTLRALT